MDELLDLEDRGWQALSSTDPVPFCAQWIAHDALLVVPGMIIDREQFLAALPSEQPWTAHHIDGARTVPFVDGCAALLYKVTASRGAEPPYVALITSVYARRDGDWKIIFHQQTPSPV